MEHQELIRTSDERKRKIAVAILSEPPPKIKEAGKWWFSRSREAVIHINKDIVKKGILVEVAENFVMAEVENALIISFYYSPNREIKGFEKALHELVQIIDKYRHRGVLICEDFNARSRLWEDKHNNRRGKLLSDWIENTEIKVIMVRSRL